MKLKVEVTQKDIDYVVNGEGHRCFMNPTARALYRTTGVQWGVGAYEAWPYWAKWQAWMPDEIYLPFVHEMAPIKLPLEVIEFEQTFDAETACGPFEFTIKPYSFELEVPDWIVV